MICVWLAWLEAATDAYQAIVFERWADELARWGSCESRG